MGDNIHNNLQNNLYSSSNKLEVTIISSYIAVLHSQYKSKGGPSHKVLQFPLNNENMLIPKFQIHSQELYELPTISLL